MLTVAQRRGQARPACATGNLSPAPPRHPNPPPGLGDGGGCELPAVATAVATSRHPRTSSPVDERGLCQAELVMGGLLPQNMVGVGGGLL